MGKRLERAQRIARGGGTAASTVFGALLGADLIGRKLGRHGPLLGAAAGGYAAYQATRAPREAAPLGKAGSGAAAAA